MKLLKAAAIAVLLFFFAFLMDIVLLEWAAGCGGTYIDADGERHVYQCLFLGQ